MKNPKRIIIASLPDMGKTFWSDSSEFATEVDIRHYINTPDWQVEVAKVARMFCYEAPFRGTKPYEWYSWLYINIPAHPLIIDELYKRKSRMIVCIPKNLGLYKLKYKCKAEEIQDNKFLDFLENNFEDFINSLHNRNIPVIKINGELKENFDISGAYGKILRITEVKNFKNN